ncbi:MAG: PmoA family protein [Bacteroidota bacterium]|nr:PmoA family protein [Bacteroidota bacterium]MDP4212336.1 PmoA family protein [Bacteroidota bacterium]
MQPKHNRKSSATGYVSLCSWIKEFFLSGLVILCLASENGYSQAIARFTVYQVKNTIQTPVYIDLDPLSYAADSVLVLQQVVGNKRVTVPFQIEHGYHRFLWWILKKEGSQETQVYELLKGKQVKTGDFRVKLEDQDGALLITDEGKKVLQYNFKTVYPPEGVDTVFKRSGFIHPLWSPGGHVLTRINPPDHRHHVGIWNPWTAVSFEGKEVDFWNLIKKQGTVRFARFISKSEGPVYAGFKALQEHVVLNDPPVRAEKIALDEVWDIRVYSVGAKIWLWDFTSVLNCATPDSVILKEYRYGGFGFRATPDWNNQNSRVITSAGKTRKDADATRARWCMIDGDVEGGHSGILFMDHPANYNFPEPMRVWPENMNGGGDVFFSFSPTRNMDWILMPDRQYVLKYRMLVYDGTISPELAEDTWKSFGHPPEVTITKLKSH